MNRASALPSLLFVTVLFILASLASARPVKRWSFQELTEKADLVIVGTVSSAADAKNHEYAAAKADTWVAVDTVFSVNSILKGELKSATLTVRHHRYHDRKAEIEVIDGPSFVKFNSQLKNRYLMFLRRNAEGLYEPLTGQYDPGGSFFVLMKYHETREEGAAVGKANATAEQNIPADADQPRR